jgi:hypothetical protein
MIFLPGGGILGKMGGSVGLGRKVRGERVIGEEEQKK